MMKNARLVLYVFVELWALNVSLVTMDFLQLSDSSLSFRLNDFKVVLLSPLDSLLQGDFSLSIMHLSTFIDQTLLFLNCSKNPFSPSFSFEKIVDDWLFFSTELIQSFRESEKSRSTFSKHIKISKLFSNWNDLTWLWWDHGHVSLRVELDVSDGPGPHLGH